VRVSHDGNVSPRLIVALSLAVFTIAEPALAAPDPKLGKSALVNTVSGTVEVNEDGESSFDKLPKSPTLVRLPAALDASRGKVRIRTAGKAGGLMEGTFWKGEFIAFQKRRTGITDAVLLGAAGDGSCAARLGSSPDFTDFARLSAESDESFRTIGFHGAALTERDKTRWVTEERCDGTRTVVEKGEVVTFAYALNVPLSFSLVPGATAQHFCAADGVAPVSSSFCTVVGSVPNEGSYTGGVVTQSDASFYDLCTTNPAGEETCTNYRLGEPFGPEAFRKAVVLCFNDSGPGAYSLRWLIDGVQLGPSLPFTSDTPPGQDCISSL
jgi:hypothetical protein